MSRKELIMSNEIGALFETPAEMRFEWRISGLTSLPHEIEKYSRSPEFYFSNACWCLAIDLSGMNKKHPAGWIAVHLFRVDCGPPKALRLSLGLKKSDFTETKWKGEKTFSRESPSSGVLQFLKLSDLLKRKSELAPLDVFTVLCTLESDAYQQTESSLFRRLWNLSLSLKNILNTPKRTDVVLKLNDVKFPAHKIILESRSDVFNRMFNAEMREAQTGEVNIVDGNEGTFKVVLFYLYYGEPEGLCSQNMCEVYKAARKYDLKVLVTLCVEFMQKCLTVDTVCDVIELAQLCQETMLKECAKDYFVKHKTEVFKCAKWEKMKKENPALVIEVVEYVFGE